MRVGDAREWGAVACFIFSGWTFRGNDGVQNGVLCGVTLTLALSRRAGEGTMACFVFLWVPACAGMTGECAGMTGGA